MKVEVQLSEIQQELDYHKEECYGHLKVIQQLKLNQKEVRDVHVTTYT